MLGKCLYCYCSAGVIVLCVLQCVLVRLVMFSKVFVRFQRILSVANMIFISVCNAGATPYCFMRCF